MILVADSGSSKCDWAFFDDEYNQLKIVETIGLNPYFLSTEKILKELHKSTDLCKISTTMYISTTQDMRRYFQHGFATPDRSSYTVKYLKLNAVRKFPVYVPAHACLESTVGSHFRRRVLQL